MPAAERERAGRSGSLASDGARAVVAPSRRRPGGLRRPKVPPPPRTGRPQPRRRPRSTLASAHSTLASARSTLPTAPLVHRTGGSRPAAAPPAHRTNGALPPRRAPAESDGPGAPVPLAVPTGPAPDGPPQRLAVPAAASVTRHLPSRPCARRLLPASSPRALRPRQGPQRRRHPVAPSPTPQRVHLRRISPVGGREGPRSGGDLVKRGPRGSGGGVGATRSPQFLTRVQQARPARCHLPRKGTDTDTPQEPRCAVPSAT